MEFDLQFKPRLRPLQAFALPGGDATAVALRDPTGLSESVITLSPAALHLLAMMDGSNTCRQICDMFKTAAGATLPDDTLLSMVAKLEQARFLQGPGFEEYYQGLLDAYRKTGVRQSAKDSSSLTVEDLAVLFDEMLSEGDTVPLHGPVVGLVAPHLDYPRGRPCYAAAYANLRGRRPPDRIIILGTNHFGRSTSVVATASSFQTPLGTTTTDVDLLERLEERCGDLRKFELDHLREHSIELQVAWLQHIFGAGSFAAVPILCPDPSGPTRTAPLDGQGVDLRDFAKTLGSLLAEDGKDNLIVAGADLSHAGAAFGDERRLDAAFLDEIRIRDCGALEHVSFNDPDGWLERVAHEGNPTRICSAGCIFTLATALSGRSGTLLRYHQAVDQPSQTCVTCAAVAFT
jgi:AmmeMemoRadiSam system protein B